MSKNYRTLTFKSMPVGAGYARPKADVRTNLTAEAPALSAMTDLRQVTALTVERTNTLSSTLERMKKLGVRMLLVTSANGAVMGVVTVTDLESGRPEKIAAKTGENPDSLFVQDIMTLRGKLEVLRLEDVEQASVGDMLRSLSDVKRRHALVMWNNPESGEDEICGVFSLTGMCGRIGLDVKPGDKKSAIDAALETVLAG